MAAIIDLSLIAYGNTAFTSPETWTCQHGEGECESDVLELCLQYELAGADTATMFSKSMEAWPFILCMEEAEGDPAAGASCYQTSMIATNQTSIPWSTITECASTLRSDMMTAAMKATPDHDYVPWVEVGGVVLDNSQALQKAVCDAYRGVPPASCHLSALATEAKAIAREGALVLSKCGEGSNAVSDAVENVVLGIFKGVISGFEVLFSAGGDTCEAQTSESGCMSTQESGEGCAWCSSGAVGASCALESLAKTLPTSVFECEYQ